MNKLVKYNIFIVSGALLLTLETTSLKFMIHITGRTHHRIRSPRSTASSR